MPRLNISSKKWFLSNRGVLPVFFILAFILPVYCLPRAAYVYLFTLNFSLIVIIAAAFEYGRIYHELARLGRPIGVVDTMIAAIAMTLGNCTVVSSDSDLRAVPGLNLADWRA